MIETLFPREVHTCCTTEEPDPGLLYPEEAECVRGVVPLRRREFAQGRLCARRALAELGIRNFPLLMKQDRSPVWPEAIVGSLSHSGGYCAVALARKCIIGGLGLDVDTAESLEEELVPLICGASEIARLEDSREADRGLLAKLVFSAKESVFKCVYPLTGVFLDFHDCEIELQQGAGSFSATLTNPRLPPPWKGRRLRGRFARGPKQLFTGIALSAESLR
ncbi:MAG: 4'-phosphopantetheinyl transferase superfamily protein [Candidatus Eisenbacteria bacterium]|uniref:4'-phosphopantetheinyl transferase superfamily protein n=1 Tax=Eiseniibacteriota bacterium TaxID=2212470 RepID=A0A538TP82_UNCEI|nr:MAG: 4'-phosphopantetheinyl transferase superfamily protein [Candidatus Eisenbacteria bacterium]